MQPNPGVKPIVWWVLWASFLGGLPVMYFALGPKARALEPAFSGNTWLIAALPVIVAMIFRWTVLPRIFNASAALPMFLIGIALCESSLFFGLFIFPDHALTLFICSLLGTIQFAPYFAHTM